jgi:hypothetical protein
MGKTATEIDADPSMLRNPDAQHKVKPSRSGQGHGKDNQAATGKKRTMPPAFIMSRLTMLDSVAYWALKPIEVRILQVIEIEHMRHGGVENGRLIVTRRQLENRGIPLKAIAAEEGAAGGPEAGAGRPAARAARSCRAVHQDGRENAAGRASGNFCASCTENASGSAGGRR